MWMKVLLAFDKYMGRGLIWILFLGALTALFILEKRKPMRIMFVYLPVVILLIFLNPFVSGFFFRTAGEDIYYRVLWLVPVSLEIGYGIIAIATVLQEKKRVLFLVFAALCIVTGGNYIYKDTFFSKAENIYHMPQAVVDICDTVHIEGREVMVALPMEFVGYARQYDATICMPYGRDADYYETDFSAYVKQNQLDWDVLMSKARQYGCHYIVLACEKNMTGSMEENEVEFVATFDGYNLYKDTTMYFGLWDD